MKNAELEAAICRRLSGNDPTAAELARVVSEIGCALARGQLDGAAARRLAGVAAAARAGSRDDRQYLKAVYDLLSSVALALGDIEDYVAVLRAVAKNKTCASIVMLLSDGISPTRDSPAAKRALVRLQKLYVIDRSRQLTARGYRIARDLKSLSRVRRAGNDLRRQDVRLEAVNNAR